MVIPLGVPSYSNRLRYRHIPTHPSKRYFLETLNDHAPLKQKTIRANHVPYMTKTLRKAMMHRSQLETKYRKQPTKSSVTENKRIFAANYIKKNGRNIYILI